MTRTPIDITVPDLTGKRAVVTGASDGMGLVMARRLATDLNWDRGYDGMRAYRQSKIAFGLFGLELERRSRADGWGITSNLSHPGVAPTNLLAARPELGRAQETSGRRMIRWLSARGILAGTVESAALPALMAATDPRAKPGALYGPGGFGNTSGAPAEQRLYGPLRSADEAARVWAVSERLTGTAVSAG
ncbi:hypothetical protein GCM10027063_06940 [Promicromonospora xylanilytica]